LKTEGEVEGMHEQTKERRNKGGFETITLTKRSQKYAENEDKCSKYKSNPFFEIY